MSKYIKLEDAIDAVTSIFRVSALFSGMNDNENEWRGKAEKVLAKCEVINGMADTIAKLEYKIEFICEQLAHDFDLPCNFSPMDEIMLSIGRCGEDCGEVPNSECWKRYFEEMQRRAEQ